MSKYIFAAMITNFSTIIEGIHFELLTMNIKRLQLFQVYGVHGGRKVRFHMQMNEGGEFMITDKSHLPEIYLPLEKALNEKILEHAASIAAL